MVQIIKFLSFVVTVNRRSAAKNEVMKLVVQMGQGLVNVLLYILTYTKWNWIGVQVWFWSDDSESKDFFTSILAALLGCIQFYYLFLVICAVILTVFLFGFFMCNGFRNPFRS